MHMQLKKYVFLISETKTSLCLDMKKEQTLMHSPSGKRNNDKSIFKNYHIRYSWYLGNFLVFSLFYFLLLAKMVASRIPYFSPFL